MFIDTHAQLDFKEFDHDREEVIKRAFDGGVQKIINVGCNLERSKAAIELAQEYDNIYAAVGIHPHDAKEYELEIAIQELEKLTQNKKVVAIGECGLDYYRLEGEGDRKIQQEFFKAQIKLAQKLNLPFIIHCRDAFNDLLKILISTNCKQKAISCKGVSHCFSGNLGIARKILDLGFLISFTGSITYAKPDAEILKVVREVSLDKIMIETDCPYLAPVPHRGKRNEPLFVKCVAEKISEIKGISLDEVEKTTTKNAIKLFSLR